MEKLDRTSPVEQQNWIQAVQIVIPTMEDG